MPKDEQLESRVQTFDPSVKLFIAIAAKISTLHALAGRYTQHLTLADLSPAGTPSGSPPPSPSPTPGPERAPPLPARPRDVAAAQRELDAEQARVRELMRQTVAHATHWLVLVCTHLGVEMRQLPEEPDAGMRMPEALDLRAEGEAEGDEAERRRAREKREWDCVWELVLVSLGLVGAGQQAGEPDKEKKTLGVGAAAAAKVGGLFSSSKGAPPSMEGHEAQPPPLNYTALSRSLVVSTAQVLGISAQVVADVERTIAQFLYFQLQQQSEADQKKAVEGRGGDTMTGWDEAAKEYREKAAKKGNTLKWAATGAGFVLGGVAIGLTGGLAAPAIAAGLGTFGIATFSGAGGAVLIGGLAGYRTHRRMKGLENVSFEPITEEGHEDMPQIPSLTAMIVASGFLLDLKDSVDPWRSFIRSSKVDAYALKADPQTFLEAGRSLDQFIKNRLIAMGGVELVKRTALAAVYAGVALPLTVFKGATTAFDSEFSQCKDKAKKAGVLLAEILEKEVQGKRPVVLIGYGPGASLIFACLQHLHKLQLGDLVYSAVLISLPDSPSPVAWAAARSVVAHELVNAYSAKDWVLGVAARLYTLSTRIAGLRPVRIEGVTDVNISDLLGAHMDLRHALPAILERVCGAGGEGRRGEQPLVDSASTVEAEQGVRALGLGERDEDGDGDGDGPGEAGDAGEEAAAGGTKRLGREAEEKLSARRT
ncbi:hypothetical protein JCM3770_003102 [Rhodotorula araucariae]